MGLTAVLSSEGAEANPQDTAPDSSLPWALWLLGILSLLLSVATATSHHCIPLVWLKRKETQTTDDQDVLLRNDQRKTETDTFQTSQKKRRRHDSFISLKRSSRRFHYTMNTAKSQQNKCKPKHNHQKVILNQTNIIGVHHDAIKTKRKRNTVSLRRRLQKATPILC